MDDIVAFKISITKQKLFTVKPKYWDRIMTEKLFSTAQLEAENQVVQTLNPFPKEHFKI